MRRRTNEAERQLSAVVTQSGLRGADSTRMARCHGTNQRRASSLIGEKLLKSFENGPKCLRVHRLDQMQVDPCLSGMQPVFFLPVSSHGNQQRRFARSNCIQVSSHDVAAEPGQA